MKNFLGALLLLAPSFTFAQGGVHEHDGFFLRLNIGYGYSNTTLEPEGVETSVSGDCISGGVAVGAVVAPGLALHASFFGPMVSDPTFKDSEGEGEVSGLDLRWTVMGAGLTYYFNSNVYFSGSLGVAEMEIDLKGEGGTTDSGVGGELMLGREWWVSDNWGLGVAGKFFLSRVPDKGGDPVFVTTAGSVVLSATFN